MEFRYYFNKYFFFFLLIILISISTIFWWHFYGNDVLKDDAYQYNEIAKNILHRHEFSLNGRELTMFREPGYPFFLYLIYKISGLNIHIVQFVQCCLYFLTILLFFILTKKIFNLFIAKWLAIIMASYPIFNIFTNFLYSEILVTFLVALFLMIFYYAQIKKNSYLYIICGLILGVFILIKSAFIFLIILIPLLILLLNNREKQSKIVIKIVLFLTAFLIVVTPWMYRNYFHFGQFAIAQRGELLLYLRSIKTTYNTQAMMKYVISAVSGEYLVRRFIDKDYNFYDEGGGMLYYDSFIKQKAQDLQTENTIILDQELKKEAIRLISSHPVKFFSYGLIEIITLNSPIMYYEKHFSMFRNNVSQYTFFKLMIILLLRIAWGLFLFLVVSGIYYVFKEKKILAYIFIIFIADINITLFFLQGYPRSLMPVLPLYFLLALHSLHIFWRKFLHQKKFLFNRPKTNL